MHRTLLYLLAIVVVAAFTPSFLPAQSLTWIPLDGPPGGNVASIAALDDGAIMAGTVRGGLFVSTDGGASWGSRLPDNGIDWRRRDVIAVRQAPDGAIVVAATDAVYVTRDRGATWKTLPAPPVSLADADVDTTGAVWARAESGALLRLARDSSAWREFASQHNPAGSLAVADAGTVYVTTYGGVLDRWTPLYGFWRVRTPGTHMYGVYVAGRATFVVGDSGMFVTTDLPDSSLGVPRWRPVTDPRVALTGFAATPSLDTLWVAGTRNFGRGGGVWVSTDTGVSWRRATRGLFDTTGIRSLVRTRDAVLLVGTASGVFRSSDGGGNWRIVGVAASDVTMLAVTPRGTMLAQTSEGARAERGRSPLLRSSDRGASWQHVDAMPDTSRLSCVAATADGALLAGTAHALRRSTDDGVTWRAYAGPVNVWSLVVSRTGSVLAGGSSGTFRSTDHGASWNRTRHSDLRLPARLLVESWRTRTLYAATATTVFHSTDDGSSWQLGATGLDGDTIRAIAAHQNGVILLGTTGGLFRSEQDGASWSPLGFARQDVPAVGVDSSEAIVVGTRPGTVYRTTDVGGVWVRTDDGMSRSLLRSFVTMPDGTVLAATADAGLYALATTSAITAGHDRRERPFFVVRRGESRRLRLDVALTADSHTALVDLLGREYALDMIGDRDFEIPASVAPGVYLLTIRAADVLISKRLLVE